jgi:Cu+-exporting ATPase
METLSDIPRDDCIRWASALESHSEHPFGQAILRYADTHQPDWHQSQIQEFHSTTGAGIEGKVEGQTVAIGKPSFLKEHGVALDAFTNQAAQNIQAGQTPVCLAVNQTLAAYFLIADPLKPEASKAIRQLQQLQIHPVMLSGDRTETAQAIGQQAGLSSETIHGNLSPQGKLEIIQSLQQDNQAIVGMVGDGINDAPALAQADVSIAIGTGTDIAMQTAQITLVHGDITKATDAILLSRAILTVIRQNLFWAFFYNLLAIPAAALGYLHPMMAAATMSLSSITVVLNSLRLRRLKLNQASS